MRERIAAFHHSVAATILPPRGAWVAQEGGVTARGVAGEFKRGATPAT